MKNGRTQHRERKLRSYLRVALTLVFAASVCMPTSAVSATGSYEPLATGTMTDAVSGEPIEGAWLNVDWYDDDGGRWEQADHVSTDDQGAYTVHDTHSFGAGDYRFRTYAFGYVHQEVYESWDGGDPLELHFELERAELIAEGTVTDAVSGEPIEGVYLTVGWYNDDGGRWEWAGLTSTDEDGAYTFYGWFDYGAGDYRFRVEGGAVGYVNQEVHESWDGGAPLELHFELERAEPLATGTVTDVVSGEPVEGVYLIAEWYDDGEGRWEFADETSTDEGGAYTIHDAAPFGSGDYRFRTYAVGYVVQEVHESWDGGDPLELDFALTPEAVDPDPSTIDIQHDSAGVVFDRWITGYSTVYSGGGYVYGRWAGTELTAEFTGSKVRWIGPKQPAYGMADIYIDDVLVAEDVDCYAPDAEKTYEALIWESDTLADGPHTLSIRLKGAKNPASAAHFVVIDRFEVDGVAPQGGGTRHDERDGAFTGSWLHYANPTYYDKTYSYSRWTNATFTLDFEGTGISWVGPRTPNYGMADVYIDGVKVATVDQYKPVLANQGWREVVWQSPTLSPGTHTLEIKPLGTKNPSATDYNIVIDAFDVRE